METSDADGCGASPKVVRSAALCTRDAAPVASVRFQNREMTFALAEASVTKNATFRATPRND